MFDYQLSSQLSAVVSDAFLIRRLTRVWLTTGIVPVAHMVADVEDPEITGALPPRGGSPAPATIDADL